MKFQQLMKNQHMPKLSIRTEKLAKFEFLFLGLMLLCLHLALANYETNSLFAYALLLTHLGFFLLWQPLLSAEENFNFKTVATSLLLIVLLFYLVEWWLITLWIVLLAGLVGGNALIKGLGRVVYATAAVILFLELGLKVTPGLYHLDVLSNELNIYIDYAIIIACFAITVWPMKQPRIVKNDVLHSLLISFGLFTFYLTSIVLSFTHNINYIQSLLTTTLSLAGFLLIFSLLWMPKRGLSAIAHRWEQHILNIGNPFEHWVNETSLLGKNKKIKPESFLQYSIEHLLNLPWVSGIRWQSSNDTEFHGVITPHSIRYNEDHFEIEIYSHIPMGNALKIHAQLLMQLMAYFYMSKLREVTLKNQTHLKAVYETGSKLTHDIKNILQSLQTLTAVVQTSDDPAHSHELLERQLPLLTQRLQSTLDKLQTKTNTGQSFKPLKEWWTEMQSRYHGRDIEFSGELNKQHDIDTDVFDSIIENLLENARSKRRADSSVNINTHLVSDEQQFYIEICDSGFPMSESRANKLFNQILPSKDGYGIGLYQSAQLARRNGYDLKLTANEDGKVCFRIETLGR